MPAMAFRFKPWVESSIGPAGGDHVRLFVNVHDECVAVGAHDSGQEGFSQRHWEHERMRTIAHGLRNTQPIDSFTRRH